jgi:CRP/FNR family transcriptional regulator, cyclic AMP receptor protein
MSAHSPDAGLVSLLKFDPDLGDRIPADRLTAAREASLVRVERLAKGVWAPAEEGAGEGFGLLLLSGFLVRRVGREGRFAAELLGPGDLLRPWQAPGRIASRPFESTWQTVAPAELAVLDADFVERVSPHPEIAERLVDRAMLRSRHLALGMAVVQQRRVDQRLRALFWLLADRWGRVTPDGVRVAAPLTHALLAELVAARRPSVSAALTELAERGEVTRFGGEWVLRSDD